MYASFLNNKHNVLHCYIRLLMTTFLVQKCYKVVVNSALLFTKAFRFLVGKLNNLRKIGKIVKVVEIGNIGKGSPQKK